MSTAMRASVLAMILVPALAHADPAPPVIHTLTEEPLEVRSTLRGETIIDYLRVVAKTPALTAQINARIATTAGALGLLEQLRSADLMSIETGCSTGMATDAFVSWRCVTRGSGGPNTGGGFRRVDTDNYAIDHDQLIPVTLDTLFAKPDRAKRLAALDGTSDDDACHVTTDDNVWLVTASGVEFQPGDSGHVCALTWDQLAPLLVRDNPSKRVSTDEPDAKPARASATWSKVAPRFVAANEPDAVIDTATGVLWATKDNGADLTWDAADAYATAYRGGGHADWRLPTEAELEELTEPEMAHHDKTDCTKGKLGLLVTSAIHLSCGLAWSSSTFDDTHAIAVGFISGASRVAKSSDTKNLRALVVRTPKH